MQITFRLIGTVLGESGAEIETKRTNSDKSPEDLGRAFNLLKQQLTGKTVKVTRQGATITVECDRVNWGTLEVVERAFDSVIAQI